METLTTIDTMASDLLAKMPEILEQGIEYGGDLFQRFWTYAIAIESVKLIVIIGFTITLLYSINRVQKSKGLSVVDRTMGTISLIIPLLVCSAATVFCFTQLFLAIFLPEIYIINYFQ